MRNMIVWEAIAVYKEVDDGKVNGSARLSPPQAENFVVFEHVGFMLILHHFRCSNVL